MTLLLMNDIMAVAGWILLVVTILALVASVWYVCRLQLDFRRRVAGGVCRTVDAGDWKEAADGKCVPLAGKRFLDNDGTELDPRDYDCYIVDGDSMRYCGINNGNLIFVTKGVTVGDLADMPKPVVIKWDDPGNGCVRHKLRRAWATWIPSDAPDDMLRGIFANPSFGQIRRADSFDGEEAMAEDFKTVRLPRYLARYGGDEGGSVADVALISTTYHVKEGTIRFSIHPLSSLTGIVKGAFDLAD